MEVSVTVIVSLCIAFLGLAFGFYQYTSNRMRTRVKMDTQTEGDIQKIMERCDERHNTISVVLPELQRDVAELKIGMAEVRTFQDNIWKVLDVKFADILHSPTHKRRDLLVEQMVNGELNSRDIDELAALLDAAFVQEKNPDKRLAAAFLRARVEVERGKSRPTEEEIGNSGIPRCSR